MSPSDFVLHPLPGARPRAEAPSARLRADAPLLLADHRGSGLAEHGAELRERGFLAVVSRGLSETLNLLGAGAHRALVLDPAGVGGVELVEVLRAAPGLPMLVLLDPATPEAGLAALESRESDALLILDIAQRGLSVRELALRLRALERAAAWRHRASHDERSECLRPEAFDRRLSEQISASRRHAFPLALVLLDLDNFGRVNKRHDHTVGDRVIERMGEVLRRTLRNEDLAGRVGGDEFALALPFTDGPSALACARRVLLELARAPVSGKGGALVSVSASAGIALFSAQEEATPELVRRRAEVALRAAKHQGGGATVLWSERETEGSLTAVE